MMKHSLLITILFLGVCLPTSPEEIDGFGEKLLSFEKAYQALKLEYLGCPQRPQTNTDGVLINCSGTGSLNVQKLKKARKAAEKLFDLVPAP